MPKDDNELDFFDQNDLNIEITSQHLSLVDDIETQVRMAIANQDIEKVISVIQNISAVIKLGGMALARVMWLVKENWTTLASYNDIEEDFLDYMVARAGISRTNIDRYVKAYGMIRDLPPEIAEPLEKKNIKLLIPVSNAYAAGYDFEPSDWEKIINAPDFGETTEVIRQITGKPPRSNSLMLTLDRDGSIWAYPGRDQLPIFVGSLERNDTNMVVQRAIERIVNSTGMKVR